MPTIICLFSLSCTAYEHSYEGCPFHMERQARKKGFIPITCSTWNKVNETDKERRLRYAQEAERRRAFTGSKGQDGHVTAREGYKRLEVEAQEEIGRNVDFIAL